MPSSTTSKWQLKATGALIWHVAHRRHLVWKAPFRPGASFIKRSIHEVYVRTKAGNDVRKKKSWECRCVRERERRQQRVKRHDWQLRLTCDWFSVISAGPWYYGSTPRLLLHRLWLQMTSKAQDGISWIFCPHFFTTWGGGDSSSIFIYSLWCRLGNADDLQPFSQWGRSEPQPRPAVWSLIDLNNKPSHTH